MTGGQYDRRTIGQRTGRYEDNKVRGQEDMMKIEK